jgi:nucleoside-diphosphate-sugar epimerase
MRVLVTGVTGFIGAHVAAALVERGAEVHGTALAGAPRERLSALAPGVAVLEGDLAEPGQCREIVSSVRPEAVVHLAWYAEPGAYLTAVPQNLGSLRGGINLLQALVADGTCRRVVLAGTCLENMATPTPPVYAATKAAQHALAMGLSAASLSAACAHIHYLYGPWEDLRRMVPSVVRAAVRGEPIDVTAGTQPRDYVHVADVAAALCHILAAEITGRVDVCTGQPIHLREIFEEIGRATGRPDLIRVGARPEDDRTDWPSTGDAFPLLQLGWEPRYSLTEGIQQTTEWWATREGVSQ